MEILSMLTSGSPPIDGDTIRSTAKSRISAGDVASCLCRVDRHTYLYALSKYCLDNSSRDELNALAIEYATTRQFSKQKSEPDDVVERLALASLCYSISPSRCSYCGGTGERTVDSKVVVCSVCNGSGNSDMSVRKLAEVLGIGRWRTKKVWMQRFQSLVSDYQIRDDALYLAIKQGLQDE
mgnify:CR=1 FL=1